MPKSHSSYESENILVHGPILCCRYVAHTATRFHWICPTTWGTDRVVEDGVPNPWPPKPQAEQLLGLRATSAPVDVRVREQPWSPTAMPSSCPQAPCESELGSLGGMVPLSCVLCSFFSHSLLSLGYWVLFMIPVYHHYYLLRCIYSKNQRSRTNRIY